MSDITFTPGGEIDPADDPGVMLPLYIREFMGDPEVQKLGWDGHKEVYLYLLMAQWTPGGGGNLPIALDQLSKRSGVPEKVLLRSMKRLEKFFVSDGPGSMKNRKLDRLRRERIAKKRAGSIGGSVSKPQSRAGNRTASEEVIETGSLRAPTPEIPPVPDGTVPPEPGGGEAEATSVAPKATKATSPKKMVKPQGSPEVDFGDDEDLVNAVLVGDASGNKSHTLTHQRVLNLRHELWELREEVGVEVWRYGCRQAWEHEAGSAYAKRVMRTTTNRGAGLRVITGGKAPGRGKDRNEGMQGRGVDAVTSQLTDARRERLLGIQRPLDGQPEAPPASEPGAV